MKILPLLGCLLAASSIDSFANRSAAQITPDRTLGSENSEFRDDQVLGGARRGNNLFHSFKEFNIGANQRVDFSNPADVRNIITRVTGTEASKIDGVLGVNGTANLFFLNPNGISFGSGARLDMQGTFVGSTASELKFKEGGVYSATSPQAPLLTMTTPIGLQFGNSPGSIVLTNSRDLVTRDEKTSYAGSSMVLVGGNITIDQSTIALPGGKIELVATGSGGSASIDFNKLGSPGESSFLVPNNQARSDIFIQNKSLLSSGTDTIIGSTGTTKNVTSGVVSLQGRDIEISGSSFDNRSQILARTTSTSMNKSENIFLNATNNITIKGDTSGVSTRPISGSKGDGNNIVITAKNLDILDGAFLATGSQGNSFGKSGDTIINVVGTLRIASPTTNNESGILTGSFGSGNGGDITINARNVINKEGRKLVVIQQET